jgi:hypothetical protein
MVRFKTATKKNLALIVSILLNIILLLYVSNQTKIIATCESEGLVYCKKFDQRHRLKLGDLSSDLQSLGTFQDKVYEWDICKPQKIIKQPSPIQNSSASKPIYEPVQHCQFSPRIEQSHQLQFFSEGEVSRSSDFFTCAVLPPKTYQWPSKQIKYSASPGESAIFWPNLGLKASNDVVVFNQAYPKNAYHFDAPFYDLQQEGSVNLAAQYIPFGQKIRTMLEIGAGGGSLSVSLNKRYDVTVINTIRPEFPYCEYITERGGLCILLDSNRPMPFAKFSFDVIHHSWVYHGEAPAQWRTILLEQNRMLRPGGYLWIQDVSSNAVLETIKYLLVEKLDYTVLYRRENSLPLPARAHFGSQPVEAEWGFIFVKPNRLKDDQYPCN